MKKRSAVEIESCVTWTLQKLKRVKSMRFAVFYRWGCLLSFVVLTHCLVCIIPLPFCW